MAQDPVGGLLLAARQAANAANTTVVERPHAPLDLSIYPTTPLQQFGLFIIVFFPVVSVLLVGLRVYDRTKTKTFGADDAFIVAATVCCLPTLSVGADMKNRFWLQPRESFRMQ